jgi:hypothetical protein
MSLIALQDLVRRNNESSVASRKPITKKNRRPSKLLKEVPPPTRPTRAVGFFYPDRKSASTTAGPEQGRRRG